MKNIFFTTFFLFVTAIFSLLGQTKLTGTPIGTAGYTYNDGTDYNGNTIANVFDGNLNTYFASAIDESSANGGTKGSRGSKTGWVGLDLGSKYVITSVKYAPRPASPGPERLECGIIEGANSPDFMDAVAIGIIPAPGVANQLLTMNINSTRGFRFVRYCGSMQYRANIAELEIYGYPGEGNDSHIGQLTNLPTVNIHTQNEAFIADKVNYITATITVVDGIYVKTDNMGIRGRGNASWEFKKRPYRMKLNSATRLLNNPASAKNWTLISNEGDKTLIRNLITYNISKNLEMPYTPAGRNVDVVINGDYKGCYQLCDHIDIRPGRVDINEMTASDISGDALTGGYQLEINAYLFSDPSDGEIGFYSNRGMPIEIKSPDFNVSAQNNYIKNHINTWESAIMNNSNYQQLTDIQTFVRYLLVGEFSGNTDTFWQTKIYKKRSDDKIYFGPVWDFDIAFENDYRTFPINQNTANNGNQWIYQWGGSKAEGVGALVDKLLSYADVNQRLKTVWAQYRDNGKINATSLMNFIDSCAASINVSQDLNFKRWDNLNEWEHMMWGRGDYATNIQIVKDFLNARLAWMDTKLQYVPNSTANNEFHNISVYSNNNILYINNITQKTQVFCFDITGKIIFQTKISSDFKQTMPSGAYLIQLIAPNGEKKGFKVLV